MTRLRPLSLIALIALAIPTYGHADPPPDDQGWSGAKWGSDWTYCEGTAPVHVGCTFETQLRGFTLPGWRPITLLHTQCGDGFDHDTFIVRSFEFRGTIDIVVESESGGRLHHLIECGTLDDRRCALCASTDGDPQWSKRERLTVTTTVDGVGPWKIGIGVHFSKVPDQPHRLRTKQIAPGVADLVFLRPVPHGASITGYEAVCRSKGDQRKAASSQLEPRLRLRGLEPNSSYACKVAARSDRGVGWWSDSVRVPPTA